MFNQVLLMGRIAQDIKTLKEGGDSLTIAFPIAVNHRYKDKKETLFIDVIAFGKNAETIQKFFKKGSPIFVQGRLAEKQYVDKEGQKRKSYRVILEKFTFLPNSDKQKNPVNTDTAVGSAGTNTAGNLSAEEAEINDDDDIPF